MGSFQTFFDSRHWSTCPGRSLTGIYCVAPKNKAQKMSMSTFLADESERPENLDDKGGLLTNLGLGSWADEMEDMPLPCTLDSIAIEITESC